MTMTGDEMSIGRKIHDMVMREHGVLLHSKNNTYLVHVYNWNIKVQHSDDERKEAARYFWDSVASRELKETILANRDAWRIYCADRRSSMSCSQNLRENYTTEKILPARLRVLSKGPTVQAQAQAET